MHIRTIAAPVQELAGNRNAALRWASEVKRIDPRYDPATFSRTFPFHDEQTLKAMTTALKRLII